MKLVFSDTAWEDYLHWQASDANMLDRVNALIKECQRTPFKGTGKPEPLKGDLEGLVVATHHPCRPTGLSGHGRRLEPATGNRSVPFSLLIGS